MASLTEASTPTGATIDIQPGWRQGRGAFGGLTIATMIRGASAAVADPTRKVRSVTAELFAAVEPGPAELTIEALRRGRSLSAVRVLLSQNTPKAHAVVVLAVSRTGAGPVAWQDLQPPPVASWRQLEPAPMNGPSFPEFAQHFEYRFVEGVPFTGGEARAIGWVRPTNPGPARDAGYIAALADAWFPATLVRLTGPRQIATITYTLEIIAGVEGLDPDAPLLYRGTVPVCADGYFVETRELWGEDGRLVALNHQTFAIID
ncbi:MAG: thioesterase family protein [Kofleriaceae bacterium]